MIKADFDQRAAQIQEKLNMGRGRTDEWNRDVVNLVRARLAARKQKPSRRARFRWVSLPHLQGPFRRRLVQTQKNNRQ